MPNTPTYLLYHGRHTGRDQDSKKTWTRLGAVWPNTSGNGLHLTSWLFHTGSTPVTPLHFQLPCDRAHFKGTDRRDPWHVGCATRETERPEQRGTQSTPAHWGVLSPRPQTPSRGILLGGLAVHGRVTVARVFLPHLAMQPCCGWHAICAWCECCWSRSFLSRLPWAEPGSTCVIGTQRRGR